MKRDALPQLGPTLSQGAVWLNEAVKADEVSDPFLFGSSIPGRLYLSHAGSAAVTISLEVDEKGDGRWSKWFEAGLKPNEGKWLSVSAYEWEKKNGEWKRYLDANGQPVGVGSGWGPSAPPMPWVRLRSSASLTRATAIFFSGLDRTTARPGTDAVFTGIGSPTGSGVLPATVRARGENKGTLHYMPADGSALYELNADLKLQRVEDAAGLAYHKANCAIPAGVLTSDAASIIYTDDSGRRWRLPKGELAFDKDSAAGPARVCREVCTERDLFNAGGTFYELPAENAGGFAKVRPVCTHNRRIHDYCSWRGLLILTGIEPGAPAGEHIIRSDDGKAAVWAGAVDDLWKLPPPTGTGGAWKDTSVKAGEPSDPCLIWGFARRELSLSHTNAEPVKFKVELDLTGDGMWVEWKTIPVAPGEKFSASLPPEVQGRWLRITSNKDVTATAGLIH